MPALAIVIPAYKPNFVRDALESIAAQTDQRFRVYVGDDAGPPEIANACASVRGIDLVYHRFDENLGLRSLTAHWNRCVQLSKEPWVWLFSDDDVMSPGCVASFYRNLEASGSSQLLRFNTEVVDAAGGTLSTNPEHPPLEAGADFIFTRLMGQRNSYVVEYVFRRDAFDRAGGFADYPVGWCADDVTWFRLARETAIRTLPGPVVQWRASGLNITDANTAHQQEKLAAAAQFLRFVVEEVMPSEAAPGRSTEAWDAAAQVWYLDQVRYLMPIGARLWPTILRDSVDTWSTNPLRKVATLCAWSLRAYARVGLNRVGRLVSRAGAG